MSSVLQAGPCVRTNQLDFDEEVVFKAQQYLFDHIREDGDQPFCLTVSMTHPHDPYTIPKPFWDLYDDSDIPLPTTPNQEDLDPHSQRLLKVYDLWDKPLPVDKIRDARRAYFGACSYIDSNVGKLLQTLKIPAWPTTPSSSSPATTATCSASVASGTKCTGSKWPLACRC
jgi:choline-sulfatase